MSSYNIRVRYDASKEKSYKWDFRWWHFVIDLANVCGYDVPWRSSDMSGPQEGEVVVYSGHSLQNIPEENARNIIENLLSRWGLDLDRAKIQFEGDI